MIIRILDQADWEMWKKLRLEALYKEPGAFCTSFEQESTRLDEEFKLIIAQNTIFGAFRENELIGGAGFFSLYSFKTRHRGVLWGMYVKEADRGKGVGSLLINTIINYAKARVIQLHLTVIASNKAAMELYRKHGFSIYATEPRSLKLNDQFFDEHSMILKFE